MSDKPRYLPAIHPCFLLKHISKSLDNANAMEVNDLITDA